MILEWVLKDEHQLSNQREKSSISVSMECENKWQHFHMWCSKDSSGWKEPMGVKLSNEAGIVSRVRFQGRPLSWNHRELCEGLKQRWKICFRKMPLATSGNLLGGEVQWAAKEGLKKGIGGTAERMVVKYHNSLHTYLLSICSEPGTARCWDP